MRPALVVLALLLGFAGCSNQSTVAEPVVRLDGTARIPDDEGVATSLDRNSITLDGKRTYTVSDDLRSFSTYTRELEPMLGRRGQYVQIGVRGREMVWMAGIARLIEVEGDPAVYYTGRFRERLESRFVFVDGTTFFAPAEVDPPGTKSEVTVRIDPRTHRIVEITS